jgi:hypothetical protein
MHRRDTFSLSRIPTLVGPQSHGIMNTSSFVRHDRLGRDGMGLLIVDYVQAALHHAKFETIAEDGTIFGTIPGFPGVWANAETIEGCREELAVSQTMTICPSWTASI